jgi:hypothetical protein
MEYGGKNVLNEIKEGKWDRALRNKERRRGNFIYFRIQSIKTPACFDPP